MQTRLWRYDVFCATEACRAPEDEIAMWASGGPGDVHPVQHYTKRKLHAYKNEHGKTFVDPEYGGPFEVLRANLLEACSVGGR